MLYKYYKQSFRIKIKKWDGILSINCQLRILNEWGLEGAGERGRYNLPI